METNACAGLAPSTPGRRKTAALSIVSICLLAALAIGAFDTGQAMGGGIVERVAIPARMLLLVVASTLFLRLAGESWAEVGLNKPQSLWMTGALVIGGYVAIGLMFFVFGRVLLPAFGLAPETGIVFAGLRGNLGEYLYWLIPIAWGSAALGEELVFRGFLQSRLERLFQGTGSAALLALLSQAFIFGALHSYQGAGGAVLAGGTGLMIGLVYIIAGRNLWAPIFLHGLVDTVSLSAIYFGAAGAAG